MAEIPRCAISVQLINAEISRDNDTDTPLFKFLYADHLYEGWVWLEDKFQLCQQIANWSLLISGCPV